ncbi:hypothetical protein [Archangium violaceum]|uniref:Uncharacterized protein n=1 Tax=Archangium violaceum Cb vi76 TaxID=1406225 RepID=A0A084SGT5_9BACT|nr:hypothetical protein [Archangium violaceum]KFA87670.1 hypothetical protein Q664_46120 [Archangium violaceum Cb vi76]
MSDTSKDGKLPTLRLDLGFVGVINLVASPLTTLKLHPPTLAPASEAPGGPAEASDEEDDTLSQDFVDPSTIRIRQLETSFKVTGEYTGFTEQTVPATLTWVVYDDTTNLTHESTLNGTLHLNNGSFEFKEVKGKQEAHPRLRVLEHRVFGKGWIDYRITPQYPHAPSVALSDCLKEKAAALRQHTPSSMWDWDAERGIQFDNPLDVEFEPESGFVMGKTLEFTLIGGALVRKLLRKGHGVRLVIEEEDGQEKKANRSKSDLRAELVWNQENKDKKLPWLIGCTVASTPDAPRFEYPEANEEAAHEFFYSILIDHPTPEPKPSAKGKTPAQPKPVQVLKPRQLLVLFRPTLESFSLSFEPADEDSAPRIAARGQIRDLDPTPNVSVDVSLWRRSDKGRRVAFMRVGQPVNAQLVNGRFEVDLYSFLQGYGPTTHEDDLFWQWLSSYERPPQGTKPEPALFATVCFNVRHLANPGLPAYTSLNFNSEVFDAFSEGQGDLSNPLKGGSICSAESRSGPALVERVRAALKRSE